MRVAILYICTGKYQIFWPGFYKSSEKHFLPGIHKEYFVFTDAKDIDYASEHLVHRIDQQKLGWPHDTLMRFHFFSRLQKHIESFEYVFFFNANALFTTDLLFKEVAPDKHTGLVGVLHPQYQNLPQAEIPYEREQKDSLAYVPENAGTYYFQGCLSGGTSESYIRLINELMRRIDMDLERGIIAKWHDESHINKYFVEHPPRPLDPGFAYPEGWQLPFTEKIVMRDKTKHGGHSYLRGPEVNTANKSYSKSIFLNVLSKFKRNKKW